jgi:hypothetical protein
MARIAQHPLGTLAERRGEYIRNMPREYPSATPAPQHGGRSRRVIKMIRELEALGYEIVHVKDLARLKRLLK